VNHAGIFATCMCRNAVFFNDTDINVIKGGKPIRDGCAKNPSTYYGKVEFLHQSNNQSIALIDYEGGVDSLS
jgi:hypothetical protein